MDEGGNEEEEVLDEETKRKDQFVKEAIDGLMQEYAVELNAPSQDEESQRRKRKREKKEEVQPYPIIFIINLYHFEIKSKYCYCNFFFCVFFFTG